jgi:hypothetical protein
MYLDMEYEARLATGDFLFHFRLPEMESLHIFKDRSKAMADEDHFLAEGPASFQLTLLPYSEDEIRVLLKKDGSAMKTKMCADYLINKVPSPTRLSGSMPVVTTENFGKSTGDFPRCPPPGRAASKILLIGLELNAFGPRTGCTLGGAKLIEGVPWVLGWDEAAQEDFFRAFVVTTGCVPDPRPRPAPPPSPPAVPAQSPIITAFEVGDRYVLFEYVAEKPLASTPSNKPRTSKVRFELTSPKDEKVRVSPLGEGNLASWPEFKGKATLELYENYPAPEIMGRLRWTDDENKARTRILNWRVSAIQRGAAFQAPYAREVGVDQDGTPGGRPGLIEIRFEFLGNELGLLLSCNNLRLMPIR